MTPARHTVACPAAGCQGQVKIPDTLPAGEYICPCHTVRLSLSWATYLAQGVPQGRKPYLCLAESNPCP